MKKNSIILSAVVAAVVALAVGLYVATPVEQPPVGAVSGPEISGPSFTVGGQETYFVSQKFNTGTTTICSMRSPAYATSTLVFASVRMDFQAATTTKGGILDIAKDSGRGPTTTALGASMVLNGDESGQVIVASTTDGTGLYIYAPGEFVNVKYVNQGITEYSQVTNQLGNCTAKWVVN